MGRRKLTDYENEERKRQRMSKKERDAYDKKQLKRRVKQKGYANEDEYFAAEFHIPINNWIASLESTSSFNNEETTESAVALTSKINDDNKVLQLQYVASISGGEGKDAEEATIGSRQPAITRETRGEDLVVLHAKASANGQRGLN